MTLNIIPSTLLFSILCITNGIFFRKENRAMSKRHTKEDTKHKQQVFLVPAPMQPNRDTRKTIAPTPMNK